MTDLEPTADVVIVGAGPVGLAAAALLGQAGIATVVVERSSTASSHPRAFGIHGRTMEIFRQWGVADQVRAGALAPERSQGFGWFSSLVAPEIGSLTFGPDPGPEPSPEPPCFCPQSHYENVLLQTARSHASVQVLFDQCAVGFRQDQHGVEVDLVAAASPVPEAFRAKYLLAADGARSSLRDLLGIQESGLPPFGHSVHAYFRADLSRYVADKPYMLIWILNRLTRGTLAVASKDYQEWTYNVAADRDHDVTTVEMETHIRAAVGVPDLPLEVLDVLRWDYEQKVSDTWRSGRVFLLGDAAHRFPPHGAFGMNSGVQDAQNLAWKLALVLRGVAGDALLSTYEDERRPVADTNGRQSVKNTRNLELVSGSTLPPEDLDALASADSGSAARKAFTEAIALQAAHLRSAGQQFGIRYQSHAVVPDGQHVPESGIFEYVASGAPGGRAPHLWLKTADGRTLSTVDLFGRSFVLLAAEEGLVWLQAVQVSPRAAAVGMIAHQVSAAGPLISVDRQFTSVYGVTPSGAVVVRPDGYVLARFPSAVADPVDSLEVALARIVKGTSDG